jgi:hypothetical protein
VDTDAVARAHLRQVAQRLDRGHAAERHRGGLLERKLRRREGQLAFARDGALCHRRPAKAVAGAENPVPGPQPRHPRADGTHHAGDVEPGRPRELSPGHPHQLALADEKILGVQRRGAHVEHHLAPPRRRVGHLAHLEDLGGAESIVDRGAQGSPIT